MRLAESIFKFVGNKGGVDQIIEIIVLIPGGKNCIAG